MPKVTYKGNSYDAIIIDENIVLQSMTHDVVFENGAVEMERQAESEYFAGFDKLTSLHNYISEYIDRELENYIKWNPEKAIKVVLPEHQVN